MEHGLPSQTRRASVLTTFALACGLAATGGVVSSAPVSAHYAGRADDAAAHTAILLADHQLQGEPAGLTSNPGAKKARSERKAKREAKKSAKKSHDSDSTVAATKATKASKGSAKQAIDDSSLQGGNNDPLEGL